MASKKVLNRIINVVVSWGATVVIIGLMFKILHKPHATEFISAGLITEAAIFFILGIQEWIMGDGDEQPVTVNVAAGAAYPGASALDEVINKEISPELIRSLKTGLETFGDKVASISNLAAAADETAGLTAKVKAAAGSFDKLSIAFENATANLAEMANSNVDSKAYHDQVNKLAKNLSELNAVYELELQDSSAHLKAMNKFYQNLSLTMQNFNESLEDSKSFKDEVGRLAKNLASLNSIYGNMLSAMNQPRV
jgi:gliding motility-associated protein GldL